MYPWLQPHLEQILDRYLHSGRMPHALLLSGVAGIGKLSLARELARVLLCRQPQRYSACGDCKACKLVFYRTHPDLFELSAGRGKAKTDSGSGGELDNIRKLRDDLQISAHLGGNQVCIIDKVELLSVAGANALLKTLEEPEAKRHIILVHASSGKLLPTIKSRCVQITCQPPDTDMARDWLIEQLGKSSKLKDNSLLDTYLPMVNYAPLRLLQWLQASDQLSNLVQALETLKQPETNPLQVSSSLYKFDPGIIFNWLVSYLAQEIKKQAANPSFDRKSALDLYRYMLTSKGLHQVHNLDIRMIIDHFTITWHRAYKSASPPVSRVL